MATGTLNLSRVQQGDARRANRQIPAELAVRWIYLAAAMCISASSTTDDASATIDCSTVSRRVLPMDCSRSSWSCSIWTRNSPDSPQHVHSPQSRSAPSLGSMRRRWMSSAVDLAIIHPAACSSGNRISGSVGTARTSGSASAGDKWGRSGGRQATAAVAAPSAPSARSAIALAKRHVLPRAGRT